jgi:hypothetical protein
MILTFAAAIDWIASPSNRSTPVKTSGDVAREVFCLIHFPLFFDAVADTCVHHLEDR